jgi:transposase
LYSVVKQWFKCNAGKVFNCSIQFLLAMVLSIEERAFLVEYVFREGNRYTDLVQQQFAENVPETPVPHRSAIRRLTDKFRETGSVLDAERSGRPSKLNEKKLMDISHACLMS